MGKRSHRKRGKRSVFQRRTQPGAAPGTLVADPEAPHPVIRLVGYGPGDLLEKEIADPGELAQYAGRWPVLWVNVDGLGDAATIQKVARVFDLHPLALEDVVNVHQRPKLEPYGPQHFIVAREVALAERVETEQISLFLGKDFLLTFQEYPGDCFEPVRQRIRDDRGRHRRSGPDYLAYSLLDAVIDGYFPVLEACGEKLETLEDEIVGQPDSGAIARIHAVKRDLLHMRRAIWPFREAINSLFREPSPLVTDETRLYLRDCYDHTIQIIDILETYREVASGLVEVYLSSISSRTNEIVKVLTIIATIFMPLSFLAGLYGMNFNTEVSPWNMPELNKPFGYPMVLLLMAAVVALMLVFFRRKGFLGSRKESAPSA